MEKARWMLSTAIIIWLTHVFNSLCDKELRSPGKTTGSLISDLIFGIGLLIILNLWFSNIL